MNKKSVSCFNQFNREEDTEDRQSFARRDGVRLPDVGMKDHSANIYSIVVRTTSCFPNISDTIEMEDDPVIKEIPVFLSKTLADKLFVVQYITQSPENNYDNATVLKSSIKPENREIQLELAIDTQSVNFDRSKGVQIVLNAEGSTKEDEEKIFDSELMEKIMLSSTRLTSDSTNQAVGIFQDDELHITPIREIVQLNSHFHYLEKSDKRAREEAKAMGEDGDEDEDNANPVKVAFARPQPEHLKKIQEQSFHYHTKKSLEEPWIRTTYVPACDPQAELTRMEMFCSSTEDSLNTLNLSSKQYLACNLLTPQSSKEQQWQDVRNHAALSLDYITSTTLPLLDQIRIIMKDAKIMSFAKLRSVLSSEHDVAAVLKYLQQVAVLVQGNWIVNSELIYSKDSFSSQSGISAEFMCRARDYILLSFTEQQYLDRKTVSSVIKLPSAEIDEIFEKLATREPQKGWQLIIPPNWDFCDRYPEIAQRQEMFWDAKRKHLREAMESQCHPPQRQRRKSNRESLGTENEERNVGRGRKSLKDSSQSDNDGANESGKLKKISRSRKMSETTTT